MATKLKPELERIGKRIKEARKDMDLTQEGLGHKLNIQQSQISEYESGIYAMNLETLLRLANVLNKPMTYFFVNGDESDVKIIFEQLNELFQRKILATMSDLLQLQKSMKDEDRAFDRIDVNMKFYLRDLQWKPPNERSDPSTEILQGESNYEILPRKFEYLETEKRGKLFSPK